MRNILEATPTDSFRVLFVASPEDQASLAELARLGFDFVKAERRGGKVGDYAKKVNLGFRNTEEPWVFTAADDLVFSPGWTECLAEVPDSVGVIGTQDLGNDSVIKGTHSTHSFVRRSYALDPGATWDTPGDVLCEKYWHEFVDNELVEVAKVRNAWHFADDSIVEHLHPLWGKRPHDSLTRLVNKRMAYGRRIFRGRRSLWLDKLTLASSSELSAKTHGGN